MRRVLANFVLWVFLWSVAAPLALAVATDPTPACCRRDGEHHCLGMSGVVAQSGEGFFFAALAPRCPYHSQIATPVVTAQLGVSLTNQLLLPTSAVVRRTTHKAASPLAFSSFFQRGPPEQLS